MKTRVENSPSSRAHGRDADQRSHDPRRLQIHRPTVERDVPYLPTDEPVVDAMLKLANVTPADVVYDLGCGDGRVAIAAAKLGARAVGCDVDLARIRESYENAKRAGVAGRVTWLRQSFFDVDLREATVVTLYLLPSVNVKLRPKLLWELRPGTRVVCNYFDMGDWVADVKLNVCQRVLHLFHVPTWVGGAWDCVVNSPDGRRRMRLTLTRRYQRVWGTARVGVPLSNATLCGNVLTFEAAGVRYRCRADDHCLRGTSLPSRGGETPNVWCGWRR